MILDSLRTSLNRQLAHPFTSEAEVAYLLITVRKLAEMSNEKDRYFALSFYCDWVLHARLDRVGAKRIIAKFENYYASGASGQWRLTAELTDVLSVRAFRCELHRFLEDQGVPALLCATEEAWVKFVDLYARIITGCPLIIKSGRGRVRQVTACRVEVPEDGRVTPSGWRCDFALEWTPEPCLAPGEPSALKGFKIRFTYPPADLRS